MALLRALFSSTSVLLAGLALGCASRPLAPPATPTQLAVRPAPEAPRPPPTAQQTEEAPLRRGCEVLAQPNGPARRYFVATEEGVLEVASDGLRLRRLSPLPAQAMLLLPGGREALVVGQETGELRSLTLDTCVERRVRALGLAAERCVVGRTASEEALALRLQSSEDLWLSQDGTAACMTLSDRNVNMANALVRVQVRLADAALSSRLLVAGDCAAQPESGDGFQCAPHPRPRAAALPGSNSPRAFALEGSRIVRLGARGAQRVRGLLAATDVEEEAPSPSGRWSLLRVHLEEGDYIHRSLVLFDRDAGELYGLRAGAWPSPLSATALRHHEALVEAAASAVGESTVRWLDADTLQLGDLLITPGRGVAQLPGELAR